MIWLAKETKAAKASQTDTELNFRLRMQNEYLKDHFLFKKSFKDLKATFPTKSGRIVALENVDFSNMTNTRQLEEQLYLRQQEDCANC